MRTRQQLQNWRRDIGSVRDPKFLDLLDRLLDGDESVRDEVERTCDEIDSELPAEDRDY